MLALLDAYGPGRRRRRWGGHLYSVALVVALLAFEADVVGVRHREFVGLACFYGVLTIVATVLVWRRPPHTTITREGLEVLPSAYSRRWRVRWVQVREVRPPAPLGLRGALVLTTGKEVLLTGMRRADVDQLEVLLGEFQQLASSHQPG